MWMDSLCNVSMYIGVCAHINEPSVPRSNKTHSIALHPSYHVLSKVVYRVTIPVLVDHALQAWPDLQCHLRCSGNMKLENKCTHPCTVAMMYHKCFTIPNLLNLFAISIPVLRSCYNSSILLVIF